MRNIGKKNQIDMTTGSILGKQIQFIIPLFFTGMLQLLYNTIDIIVVGRFAGLTALSAVGSTGSITHLLLSVFMGLSIGTSVTTANYYGSKNHENIHKTVHTSIFIAIITGIFLALVGFLLTPTLLSLMGSPDDVREQAILYMRIIFLGMPFNLLYNFSAAILRAVGDTKRPLHYLGISGVVNVLLNLIFVILLNMDVAGVALATIISQALSVVLIINSLMKNTDDLKLTLSKIKFHKDQAIQIIKIGLPAGIQSSFFAVSNVTIQSSINSFGSVAMAGNAASGNIEGFMFTALNCIHQSVITFASQNMGANQIDRIRKNFYYGSALVFAAALVICNTIQFFRAPLIQLYTSDLEAIEIGTNRLYAMCSFYFFLGLMDVMSGLLRGIGKSLSPMLISLIGVCGFRLVWIFTIFAKLPTLPILYLSYPITWMLTWWTLLVYYFIVMHREFPKQPPST